MTLADAFAKSINTAAARLAQQVGLNRVIAAARDLGVTAPVPSLALGAAEMNLLELTAAYAAVKAGEMPIEPWGVAGFSVGRQTRLQSMGPHIGAMQSLQPYQNDGPSRAPYRRRRIGRAYRGRQARASLARRSACRSQAYSDEASAAGKARTINGARGARDRAEG
jgi:membrane carboxypeptidase/penicillin-binding protein